MLSLVRVNDCSIEPLSPNSRSYVEPQQSLSTWTSPLDIHPLLLPFSKVPFVIRLSVVKVSACNK